ncbi:hypothetical protein SH1V18_38460 [Vallitalea longa]|uniref:M23ase beta-sheet core domain-containing protein n=1 Tax=Vallitalea longa TaxID=2936439 RepID=A0A9W6DFL4_9FIRM|nr:M23 family metallopeptidase [Vallitalea longa]GKX31366.1 hypothetical protein SH1V18_38460 [Vallitalea longa]
MSINPKTVYTIIKATGSIVTDEEKRKKIIIIVMLPIISILLILSIFVYILTSPLSFITGFFSSGKENSSVQNFKAVNENIIEFNNGELIFNGKYPMPAEGEITSPYGNRINPVTGKHGVHTGIDIGTKWHTDIISIADGQIVKIGINKAYGQYIIIKHELDEETFYSVYAHLSVICALLDAEVKQGQVIAQEGGDPDRDPLPGISTGHHLHFEIREKLSARSHINPIDYLFNNDEENQNQLRNDKKINNTNM